MSGSRVESGDLRRFGLLVGAAFLALGAWRWYPGPIDWVAGLLGSLGAALLAAGLISPAALALPYRAWMSLAEILGAVMTRVILAVLFFGVLTPIALIVRLAGRDLMNRQSKGRPSYWLDSPHGRQDHRHYEKMF